MNNIENVAANCPVPPLFGVFYIWELCLAGVGRINKGGRECWGRHGLKTPLYVS